MNNRDDDNYIKLNNLIRSIDKNSISYLDTIYLNQIHNEFITFTGEIEIPHIPVKELDYKTAFPIVQNLVKKTPELFLNHTIPVHNNPASDQHFIHLIQKISGSLFNFIHILKIDCKFSGDPVNILERGDSLHYPSYKTNRIYYKSYLVPVSNVDDQYNFKEIRITQSQQVDSDQYFHTYALFDDINKGETTSRFSEFIGSDLFAIPPTLYPYVQFEYFTACLNILYPVQEEIIQSIWHFEPLFIFLYSKFNTIGTLPITTETISNAFGESLVLENEKYYLTNTFKNSLKTYFNRHLLFRNDELALKGWWEIRKIG